MKIALVIPCALEITAACAALSPASYLRPRLANFLVFCRRHCALAAIPLALSACGGGNSCLDDGTCYTVGGTLSGLLSNTSITLQNNGDDNLTLAANGGFMFSHTVDESRDFSVTVLTQPTGQTCTVDDENGSGYGPADENVSVTCAAHKHSLGGTLGGLAAGGTITLQNKGSDSLTLAANGRFTFPTPVKYADTYAVTVSAQPTTPAQRCTVTNGTGNVPDTDVSTVVVTCQ